MVLRLVGSKALVHWRGNAGSIRRVLSFELILWLGGSRDLDFWRSGARHGEFWRSHQCLWSTQMDGKKSLNGIAAKSDSMSCHKSACDWLNL